MFSKILIANRGEIACRVMRTCHRMSIRTVAVHSTIDAHALHVEMADEAYLIGGPRPAESYLRGDKIIEVAKACGAEAIHPGYGFLSENEDFARAVEKAGLVFIGPTPEAIERMGLKDRAKAIMEKAGVPVVPGYHGENQDAKFLRGEAKKVGFPLLIKAVAGGGGKGMRLVTKDAEFDDQLAAARREAKNAFGDEGMLLERFVQGPHHIEYQVFGDTHGNYVHLFERECSIQRRHQKVLEETPSPFLDDKMRKEMGEAAVAAARAIAYRGAGTIEFIAGADRKFYFMEMNTRLQVEHPITEMTTGEDLVEWQLRVAAGEALPLMQAEITRGGHAIEVRLCAENPSNNFLPETGVIGVLRAPHEVDEIVRLDAGVREGDEVSVYYDPMIAKLVVWGADRIESARRMQEALAETEILGVTTNLAFLERVVRHPAFLAGDTDTAFIERHRAQLLPEPGAAPAEALVAAAARAFVDEQASIASLPPSPWNDTRGWRLNAPARRKMEFRGTDDVVHTVEAEANAGGARVRIGMASHDVVLGPREGDRMQIALDAETYFAHVARLADLFSVTTPQGRFEFTLVDPFHYEPADALPDARLTALMPGRVVKVMAKAGDSVAKGQALMILEAMKMEHTITSPREGVIERVAFKESELVPADAVLVVFRENPVPSPLKIPKRLQPLVEDGVIDSVVRQLMSGKEAMVFVVRCGGETRCAKVYKEADKRSFRQAVDYTENRKTKNSRQARAMAKGTRFGRESQEKAWQSAEVQALYRLAGAGVRVPRPFNFHEGVLVMELVTDAEGNAAPRLNDVDLTPELAAQLHEELVREVVRMLAAGIVHGDLSEYNILLGADGPVIIDLPQAVDAAGNNHAPRMLVRDVDNLRAFFGRFAPHLLATDYGKEIWSLYEAGTLRVDTPLTGRFEPDERNADLDAVMREIDDARMEEAARLARMSESP